MGTVIRFAGHSAASLSAITPKTEGAACKRFRAKTLEKAGKNFEGIRSRAFHLETAAGHTCAKPAAAVVPPMASMTWLTELSCMAAIIVDQKSTCQELISRQPTILVDCVEISPMGEPFKDIARRLEKTRLALGFESQVEFCKEIDIAKDRYNPFETGKKRISLNVAMKIKRRFAVPLDWIYCGDQAALPTHIYQRLDRPAA